MNVGKVSSVFFSPTETTRMVVRAVAQGIAPDDVHELDLTLLKSPPSRQYSVNEDLLVIGAPVYAGRIPGLATQRLKKLRGNQTPVIAITVYGNRAYDDALLELCDCCTDLGFKVVGAGAFVGKHSFSSLDQPIAHDRPDAKDLLLAKTFGKEIRKILRTTKSAEHLQTPPIPGRYPYQPAVHPSGAASGTDPALCIHCGQCNAHCPAHNVRMTGEGPVTNPDNCIWCTACVRNCPTGARRIVLPKIGEIAERLYNTRHVRREPEWFLASAQ